ncbi:hypothetical protein Tco_0505923 [Tanacetum coccineum]
MSDSEDSTVTYVAVSSPFRGLSDIGSPRVDGPPVMPEDPYAYVVVAFQAPPSPDYVPGPEYPPSPDFVPEPVYPEFMPPEDEVLPAEEQPLPAALSPTADSPDYVPESNHEEDPEEDDEDPEEDPADYPVDVGDDGDDEDESSDDDEDDDVDIEEEEEHLAPVDSTVVASLAVDHAPSVEEIKPLETDESVATPPPHPAYRVMLGYLIEMSHLTTILERGRKRARSAIAALGTTGDEAMLEDMPVVQRLDDQKLGRWMTEFTTRVRQDTDEIYTRLDDEQTERQLMAGRLNMLYRDRRAHARTTLLMEREARMSREDWGRSMDASNLARLEVMSLHTTVLGQQAVITELQATDRMIDQGVTAALAARDANRSTNGDDSHNSGTGVRRTERNAVNPVGHDDAYGMLKNIHEMMDGQILSRNENQEIGIGRFGIEG